MRPETNRLLAEIMNLPASERAEIAARLLESLDGEAEVGVDAAWATEIARRCAALDVGTAVTSDWESVRRRIEREILRQ